MSDELKLCPFCGGEAHLNFFPMSPGQGKYSVWCLRCDANFWKPTSDRTTKEASIAAWNHRAHEPNVLTVEELANIAEKEAVRHGFHAIPKYIIEAIHDAVYKGVEK